MLQVQWEMMIEQTKGAQCCLYNPGESQNPSGVSRTNKNSFSEQCSGFFRGFLSIEVVVKGLDSELKTAQIGLASILYQ